VRVDFSSSGTSFNPARLGLFLLTALGILFFVFMGAAAFAPGVFAAPVLAGGTVTWWFVFAFGLIWTSVSATGLYVLAVNHAEHRA
jgi:uncharacterized membrane protein (DUF485 family)